MPECTVITNYAVFLVSQNLVLLCNLFTCLTSFEHHIELQEAKNDLLAKAKDI